MDKSGAGAYIFAKASGNLGKSFIGSHVQQLFEQKTLTELWTLLFKIQAPMVPEVILAEKIEQESFNSFLKNYVDFLNQYDNPDPLLEDLLCVYQAENLKLLVAALCNNETKMPAIKDLGSLDKLNYKAWPEIDKITGGTQFSWINHIPDIHEQQEIDFKIDIQVVRHLWQSLESQTGESKEALLKLFKTEFAIKNIVWALRLRTYFKMEKDEVIKKLIYVTDRPCDMDPVAGPALKILDMPLDEYDVWAEWKYSELINPHVDGDVWNIDPGWIENKGRGKLNKMALNIFHQYPVTTASLIGWYKIKEYELSCIRTAVESIRLNINPEEAMSAVGIVAEGGING